MKKLLTIILCLSVTANVMFGQLRKSEHWIFVWDVTLSMCGYNENAKKSDSNKLFVDQEKYSDLVVKIGSGAPLKSAKYVDSLDIYDKVVDALIERINNIQEEDLGSISLIPFDNNIIDVKTVKATDNGKKEISDYIRKFGKLKRTLTNIATPLNKAMELARLSKQDQCFIMLLTDGEHNMENPSKLDLYNCIDDFCSFANDADAYMFYVMLTRFASANTELMKHLEDCNRISVLLPGESPRLPINVRFDGSPLYNLQSNGAGVQLYINVESGGKLPEDYALKVICEDNEYIEVDSVKQVPQSGQLSVLVRLKKGVSLSDAERAFSREHNTKLVLKIVADKPDPYVVFLNDECSLEIVNKPERKMKIRIN